MCGFREDASRGLAPKRGTGGPRDHLLRLCQQLFWSYREISIIFSSDPLNHPNPEG